MPVPPIGGAEGHRKPGGGRKGLLPVSIHITPAVILPPDCGVAVGFQFPRLTPVPPPYQQPAVSAESLAALLVAQRTHSLPSTPAGASCCLGTKSEAQHGTSTSGFASPQSLALRSRSHASPRAWTAAAPKPSRIRSREATRWPPRSELLGPGLGTPGAHCDVCPAAP